MNPMLYILTLLACLVMGCGYSASPSTHNDQRILELESKVEDLKWLNDMGLQKIIGEKIGPYRGLEYGFLSQDGETFDLIGGVDYENRTSRSDVRIGTLVNHGVDGAVTKLKIGSGYWTRDHSLNGFFLQRIAVNDGMPEELNGFYLIGSGPHSEYGDDVNLAIKFIRDDAKVLHYRGERASLQKLAE